MGALTPLLTSVLDQPADNRPTPADIRGVLRDLAG